jgi:hypothetical protein
VTQRREGDAVQSTAIVAPGSDVEQTIRDALNALWERWCVGEWRED